MAGDAQQADVFAIPDFWRSPEWLNPALPERPASGFFDTDISADCHRRPLCVSVQQDGIIPPLPTDSDGLTAKSPSVAVAEVIDVGEDCASPAASEDHDSWLAVGYPAAAAAELRTWEGFLSQQQGPVDPSNPAFITEAGPAAFDQLLAAGGIPSQTKPGQDLVYLDPGQFAKCLLNLTLGRASLLFSWAPSKRSFQPTMKQALVSGYSAETLHGITVICLECGNNTRFLRSFVDKAYSAHATPCRVALANAVDRILCSIQTILGARGQAARSFVQLQAFVSPLGSAVAYFRDLVEKLSRSATDEDLLSRLFHAAHSAEYESAFLRTTLRDVLKIVSTPWTEFVEEWLGLRPETGIPLSKNAPGKGFVRVGKQLYSDGLGFELEEADYFLDERRVPSFIPQDIVHPLFETGRNLRFIRSYYPDHPLSRPQMIASSNPPKLEWQFDWDAIARIEQRAEAYERALLGWVHGPEAGDARPALMGTDRELVGSMSSNFEFTLFGKDEEEMQERIMASISKLDTPVLHQASVRDSLNPASLDRLLADGDRLDTSQSHGLTPHWSLLPALSFGPVVMTQARLVNRECMRLLFDVHRLRDHLNVQLDFQLLGNGVFCNRLSQALFDPDLNTAEREAGVALSGSNMGLRLLGRESWPPASSELRLALMSVLADSWELRSRQSHGVPKGGSDVASVPGDLSFAVRELSSEEMEKCMDPDSLEALDFLRLCYKPPTPLIAIITPMILSRYDRVFRHLLRVLRLLFVSDQLFKGAISHHKKGMNSCSGSGHAARQRFLFEARHFISGIATYFFDHGVAVPWRRFGTWLDGVEADVGAKGATVGERSRGEDHSPEQLRLRHDEMLDEIMEALLLRKRQEPVLRLLEEIFALVLRLAKEAGRGAPETDDSFDTSAVYVDFSKKVTIFITVCKGLAEKEARGAKAPSGSRSAGVSPENPIDRLLLALDMFGFYANSR